METILLVDDEPAQLRGLKIGLLGFGYQTLEASNGHEALEKLADPGSRIDMVITDYSMPCMNGMELLQIVREKYRSIPVIMMTAYGEKSLVIEALKNECSSFIEKPFNLDALFLEIERVKLLRLQNTGSKDLARLLPEMSHKINNRLSVIMGQAELGMFNCSDHQKLKKRFESIIEAVDQIDTINKQIIELSLSQTERMKVARLNLVELVEETLGMLDGLMALKKVMVEKQFEREDMALHGSRVTLGQVLRNLILNAIDAMDGSPVKKLRIAAATGKERQGILIQIEDTGRGISEENREEILEPYFTLNKRGSGLGLAVVREVIREHRGTIRVESPTGGGACFEIHLPAADDSDDGKYL